MIAVYLLRDLIVTDVFEVSICDCCLFTDTLVFDCYVLNRCSVCNFISLLEGLSLTNVSYIPGQPGIVESLMAGLSYTAVFLLTGRFGTFY